MEYTNEKPKSTRFYGIDCLKCLCAFFVICIHQPFPTILGEYFTVITRIAVPIFFMITGYFYHQTVLYGNEKNKF